MCKCFIDESYLGDCYAYAGIICHSLIHTSLSTASLQFCLPFNSVWLNAAAAFSWVCSSFKCLLRKFGQTYIIQCWSLPLPHRFDSVYDYILFQFCFCLAYVYQTQAQAQKRSEMAANNKFTRPSGYSIVPSVDSATTSTSNSSPSAAGQGTLDTVMPLQHFILLIRTVFLIFQS